MAGFSEKRCVPCEGIGEPFNAGKIDEILKEIPGWQADAGHKAIYREFLMKNFTASVRLINKISDIAESENHHPDVHLTGYRKLRIELSTHAVGGVTQNDIILAAKINTLPLELKR